jgi:maleylacetoacetate isomerase
MHSQIVLYGFWRSLATYRVRVALNLKGLVYEERIVDLSKGTQFDERFESLNPQHALPVLEFEGKTLTQSLAIMEFIDEHWPERPYLPKDELLRAQVRSLSQITIADVHPLVVPRVRQFLSREYGASEESQLEWARHWFDKGTQAIEGYLVKHSCHGKHLVGDQVTMADIAIASHVIGAQLFKANLSQAPIMMKLINPLLEDEAFKKAHPLKQVGAPTSI